MGVALLLRVLYVLTSQDDLPVVNPVFDAGVFDGWARGQLRVLHEGAWFRAPLYPGFLQTIYSIDSGSLFVRLVQVLVSTLCVGFVADIARRLAGPIAGLCAGLLLALYWPAIYFAGELVETTLLSLVVATLLWSLVRARGGDGPVWFVLAALLLGVGSLARPGLLVLLPLFVILPLWVWTEPGRPRLHRVGTRLVIFVLLVALLPSAGATLRNRIVGGETVFVAAESGVNFYLGNRSEGDGLGTYDRTSMEPWLGGYRATAALVEAQTGEKPTPGGVGRYFTAETLRSWSRDPGGALALTLRKAGRLLGAAERSTGLNIHFWRARNPLLALPLFVSWGVILGLAVAGLVFAPRRRDLAPLWLFLGLYATGAIFFPIDERVRVPLTIALCVLAGLGLAQIVASATQRAWRPLATVALLAMGVSLLSGLDRLSFAGDGIGADAISEYQLGRMLAGSGDEDAALVAFSRSLEIARDQPVEGFDDVELAVRSRLVRALFRRQRFDEADQNISVLEAIAPDDPETIYLRGRHYLWLHEHRTALPYFRRVVESHPDHAEARIGWAWCQIESRAYTAAMRNLEAAARIQGPTAEGLAAMGVVELLGKRNPRQARIEFEKAIEMDWQQPMAHRFLGELHRVDRDMAKMLYHLREALRMDPHNEPVRRFLLRSQAPMEHPEGDGPPPGQ